MLFVDNMDYNGHVFALFHLLDTYGCGSNPCRNGATCVDEDIGYKCICVEGYSGDTCDTGMFDGC